MFVKDKYRVDEVPGPRLASLRENFFNIEDIFCKPHARIILLCGLYRTTFCTLFRPVRSANLQEPLFSPWGLIRGKKRKFPREYCIMWDFEVK